MLSVHRYILILPVIVFHILANLLLLLQSIVCIEQKKFSLLKVKVLCLNLLWSLSHITSRLVFSLCHPRALHLYILKRTTQPLDSFIAFYQCISIELRTNKQTCGLELNEIVQSWLWTADFENHRSRKIPSLISNSRESLGCSPVNHIVALTVIQETHGPGTSKQQPVQQGGRNQNTGFYFKLLWLKQSEHLN